MKSVGFKLYSLRLISFKILYGKVKVFPLNEYIITQVATLSDTSEKKPGFSKIVPDSPVKLTETLGTLIR